MKIYQVMTSLHPEVECPMDTFKGMYVPSPQI